MPAITQQITFLYVADMERSARFYGGVLGLPLVLDQGSCRIYRVSAAAFLGFCERPEAISPGGFIVTLVSDEVDAWHEHLLAAGVTVERPPAESDEYLIYNAFYRDPDGHLLEIQQFRDPRWQNT
jgi:catechol 2,3-dioxygenase-like lactoylglutathione lyase family enzyme